MATPNYSLMHGAQFAKKYVNDYLKQDVPVRIIDYRNAWNVDDITLPTPSQFIAYEPLAIDEWPTVITVAISTGSFNRIGFAGPDPLYRVAYQMRTYIWVRTEGSEEVTEMRDRLTTVLRSAVLDYPCLKVYDSAAASGLGRDSFRVMIDEGSLREEFSDVTLLKGDRMMAGSYLGYTLEIDEIVSRKPIGEVSEIQVDVQPFGLSASLNVSGSVTNAEIIVN
jgi:hypothetical protein